MKNKLDDINKIKWTEEIEKNVMLYPDERIVAFLSKNFRDLQSNAQINALDIGFGSGRHLKLLLDYNFNTYGTDYSNKCIKIARKLLGNNTKLKSLLSDDLSHLDYKDFFHCIICYGAIFYRTKKEIEQDIKKLYDMLTSNGKMILNFRSKEDWLYGLGENIEGNTFKLDSRANEFNEMTYTFFEVEEISEMLQNIGFDLLNIERIDFWKNNLKNKNSWYIVQVQKSN